MMVSTGSMIFVIIIVLGTCIGNLFAYEKHRIMVRGPMPRGTPISIPIRPLDHSTMRRLSRQPTEINPDSEPVFLPLHQAKRRPMHIMERISVPNDVNNNWTPKEKDNFNVINFEAYAMKPTNKPTLKPVTQRILHVFNQTGDTQDVGRHRPNSHHKYRSRNVSKKSKKNMHMSHKKEFDDLEFYRAFLEHQKNVAMLKQMKTKPKPNGKLPIGIDYYENKKKNKIFPPITYSPLYLSHLHRSHQDQIYEDVEASNVQNVKMQYPDMLKNEAMPIIQPTIPITPPLTTMIMPMEAKTVLPLHDVNVMNAPTDPETIHSFASEPKMYKFTIDDVVIKPHSLGVVNPFTGPVTLAPPPMQFQNTPITNVMRHESILPASANTIHEHRFDPNFQTQINYPPKVYAQGDGFRRFPSSTSYKNIPIEEPVTLSQQKVQHYFVEPIVTTTQMTFATDIDYQHTAPSVKAAYEIDSKRFDKRNKKRRLNMAERHKPEITRKVNHQKDFLNNLEFSSSYSKRRTQGYNSEEETPTTPITPIKARHNKTETKSQETLTTNTPKSEKFKYFQ